MLSKSEYQCMNQYSVRFFPSLVISDFYRSNFLKCFQKNGQKLLVK